MRASAAGSRAIARRTATSAYVTCLPGGGAAGVVEQYALFDRQAGVGEKGLEIGQGAEVDVRRVVPLVGQRAGDRHASAEEQARAKSPVGEVGQRDDLARGDPAHLLEHPVGMADRLKGQ